METNNTSQQKKSSILNSLAIAGFIGIVLLLAWISVQLVQLFPSALSSLASLAEGVNQASETAIDAETDVMDPIIVTSNTSLINTGETMNINWNDADQRGSYVFAYDCIDGVAISQIENAVERQLECDTNYNVGDINELAVTIESEKNRYTDVPYSISFLATNDTKPQAMGTDVVTIINAEVNAFEITTGTSEESTNNEEIVTEPVTEIETPVDPAPQTPVFEQEFVYEIPTSDPDGFTDMAVSFIAMGEVINSSFVPGPVVAKNGGAIQFSIKNFGTKTSEDWTFSIELPNGGTYNSQVQTELKPNERAVLTIGFPAGDYDTHTFIVEVEESTDRVGTNNSFTQLVTFTN